MKKFKERRLYYFTCAKCGHRATTFKRRRVRAEICRNCRHVETVDPNQGSLFNIIEKQTETVASDMAIRDDKSFNL